MGFLHKDKDNIDGIQIKDKIIYIFPINNSSITIPFVWKTQLLIFLLLSLTNDFCLQNWLDMNLYKLLNILPKINTQITFEFSG